MAQITYLGLPDQRSGPTNVIWIGARWKLAAGGTQLGTLLGIQASEVHPVHISEITSDFLYEIGPSCALSMLTWIGGDALEAAVALEKAGFRGVYRAFSPTVPVPQLVEREVRSAAPLVNFAIVSNVPRGRG